MYAIWDANTYTIKFNKNTGVGTMQDLLATFDTNTTLPTNKFTKSNYIFDSCNTKADGTGIKYLNNASIKNLSTGSDVILYAVWTPEVYNITYDLHEGKVNGTNPVTYTIETPNITLIKPTKNGYQFIEWKINGVNNKEGIITKGTTGNLTVEAIFVERPKVESISFDIYKSEKAEPCNKWVRPTIIVMVKVVFIWEMILSI